MDEAEALHGLSEAGVDDDSSGDTGEGHGEGDEGTWETETTVFSCRVAEEG